MLCTYLTILQELLNEMPLLEQNKQYSHRHCAVYTSMDTLLAKRLAAKHNYAATNSHEMTTWDWVSVCNVCVVWLCVCTMYLNEHWVR